MKPTDWRSPDIPCSATMWLKCFTKYKMHWHKICTFMFLLIAKFQREKLIWLQNLNLTTTCVIICIMFQFVVFLLLFYYWLFRQHKSFFLFCTLVALQTTTIMTFRQEIKIKTVATIFSLKVHCVFVHPALFFFCSVVDRAVTLKRVDWKKMTEKLSNFP